MTNFHKHRQCAQALENGDLVDVTDVARELFVLPTAVTRRARLAAIDPESKTPRPQRGPDETDRIRRSLRYAYNAIENRWREYLNELEFDVPHDAETPPAGATTFVIATSVDENGQPALTIGLPDEFRLDSTQKPV